MNATRPINKEWIAALGASGLFIAAGFITQDFILTTWLIFFAVAAVVTYCLASVRTRLGLLLFVATMSLFLISRPVFDVFSDFAAHDRILYTLDRGLVANRMILMALSGLFLGQFFYERQLSRKEEQRTGGIFSEEQRVWISRIAFLFFLVGTTAVLMEHAEKILFRQTNSYEALYSQFRTSLPFVVIGFAEVSTAFLVLFLAVSRSVRLSFLALAVYVASSAPLLLVGVRAEFSRAMLFALFLAFTLVKDRLSLSKKRKLRLAAGALILGSLLLASLYTIGLQRTGQERLDPTYPFLLDFVYGQGVSYQTLTAGQEMIERPPFRDKDYAFGPFLDQYVNDLPGNPYSLEYIEKGDSMAADLGYYLLGEAEYLKGRGMGSSFIIEMYSDFGHGGVLLFSLFLGTLLGSLSHLSWCNVLIDAVKIRLLIDIFYIPRAQATRFLLNILAPKFILPILGTIVLSRVLLLLQEKKREQQ